MVRAKAMARMSEVKAGKLRRRHQDMVEGGGSHGTSKGHGSVIRSEGQEAPAKASQADAPEPGKAPARRHY